MAMVDHPYVQAYPCSSRPSGVDIPAPGVQRLV